MDPDIDMKFHKELMEIVSYDTWNTLLYFHSIKAIKPEPWNISQANPSPVHTIFYNANKEAHSPNQFGCIGWK